jgi:hypothetical protein
VERHLWARAPSSGSSAKRAQARGGPQQGLVLAPLGTCLDGLLEFAVGVGDLLLEPVGVRADAPSHRRGDDGREVVFLRDEHDDELPAPVQDLAQEQGFLVR